MIGDHDRRKTEPSQQIRTIDKVYIRHDFVKRTFNNDIALIKLKGEVSIVKSEVYTSALIIMNVLDSIQ